MNPSKLTSNRFGKVIFSISALAIASIALAQTRPTTQDVQDKFDRLIGTSSEPAPLKPQPSPGFDTTSSVAPDAPRQALKREGTYIVDRIGRLVKTSSEWEFNLEADGEGLMDPPLIVLKNLKLKLMQDQQAASNRDLRFRVTGMLTEYDGRNCVLIEKVIVLSDDERPF